MTEALRAFGYDLPTAIADLIDNSVFAGARAIDIRFQWDGERSWIRITDDGDGMTEREMVNAMRLGSRNPREGRDPKDLGRFGLGLKTASFSQCRRLTVRSRSEAGDVSTRCWDLDYIADKMAWALIKGTHADTSDAALEDLPLGAIASRSGTVVLWERLDRVTGASDVDDADAMHRFYDRADSVAEHLRMVFHRLMSGSRKITISLNGDPLQPWDPYLENVLATQRQDAESFIVNGHRVEITPFVLPHKSKITDEQHAEAAGPKGWNAQQGFYIYRNRRLLVSGDWLRFYRQEEHYKLARIMVDFPNPLDEEWKIDVRKAQARPPDFIRKEMKRIAAETRELAVAIYRHRGAITDRRESANDTFVWEQRRKHGRVGYSLNKEHALFKTATGSEPQQAAVRAYLRLIEETVPVHLINSAFTENEESQTPPYSGGTTELRDLMKVIVSSLCEQGLSGQVIEDRIRSMEPFIHHADFVEAAVAEVLKEIHG